MLGGGRLETVKTMKKPQGTEKTTLKYRIVEALQQHPMTTAVLARMSKEEKRKIVKVGRGLYGLAGMNYRRPVGPVLPKESGQPVEVTTERPAPLSFEVDEMVLDGIAEPSLLPSLDFCDMHETNDLQEEEFGWNASRETSEPKWSRV